MSRPLPQRFYARPVSEVARDLLGRHLTHGAVTLRITETEAYGGPGDTASHARFDPGGRSAPMWGPPGRLYVYLIYGMHEMVNVVTGPAGDPSAVLLRAAEVVRGRPTVQRRRGGKAGPVLLTGPGKLAQALAIDRGMTGHALYRTGGATLREGCPPGAVLTGPRVGIDYAAPEHRDAELRYAVAGSAWVSARRSLRPEC